MIVNSSSGMLGKKGDCQSLTNLLLRTDGFKHVFRGLTYKSSLPKGSIGQQQVHQGTYSSMGKRTPAKQYHFTKDTQSKLDCDDSKQFRRTQTAETAVRVKPDTREKDFLKSQKQEAEAFAKMMEKLGL